MLQKMQQRFSGWILWILVIIISLAFVLWGAESYFQKRVNPAHESIGTVNDLPILNSEVLRSFNTIAHRVTSNNNNVLPESIRPLIEKEAIKTVIMNKVLQSLSKTIGFGYSQEEIEKLLLTIGAFLEDGKFSENKFYRAIQSMGYSSAPDFINNVRNGLISNQINAGIMGSEFATEEEFKLWANILEQTRNVKYLTISTDLFKDSIQVKKREIQEFYEKNKHKFKVDELLKLEYVELSADEIKKGVKVSDVDILEYYEDNKGIFYSPQKWRVAHIWLKNEKQRDSKAIANTIIDSVKNGKSFKDLAKIYSDDKITAKNGGELYWFSAGSIDEEFEKAIKNVEKVGDITDFIEVENGIEIFQLLEIKKPVQKKLEEVRNVIQDKLLKKIVQKRINELTEDLADISYSNPNSLEDVSKQMQLPIKETSLFSKGNTSGKGILKYTNVIDAAYHPDVYENSNNSLPIRISDNQIIVVRIKEKHPERIKTFNEVSADLKSAITSQYATDKVEVIARDIKNNLERSLPTKKLFAKYKLKWITVKNLSRSNMKIPNGIVTLAFSMNGLSKKAKYYPSELISRDLYAIVNIEKITYPDLGKFDDDSKQKIKDYIKSDNAKIMYGAYMDSLKSKSKIVLKKDKKINSEN